MRDMTLSEFGRWRAKKRKPVTGTCALPGCDATFVGYGRRRFCSPAHQARAYYADRAEQLKEERRERYRRACAPAAPEGGADG